MPHQCVRCGTIYQDGSKEILAGCNCGAKLFFYIKKNKIEESKKIVTSLSDDDKQQIEKDVLELVDAPEGNEPVILDFESIRILKPGKYELDLVSMFKNEPLIYKLEEGKYVIDLIKTFETQRKKD